MTEEIHPRRRRCRLRRGGRQDLPRSSKRPLGRVPPPQVPPLTKGVLISPSPKFPRVCVWQGEASVPSVSPVWLLGNGRTSPDLPSLPLARSFPNPEGELGRGGPSASIMHALPAVSVAIFFFTLDPPIRALPASCSLNSWGAKFRVSSRSCPAPFSHHHSAACPWVTTLVLSRFTPLLALALQNSRILRDTAKASRPPLSSSPPYCPLIWALAVFSQSRTLNWRSQHLILFTNPYPGSG